MTATSEPRPALGSASATAGFSSAGDARSASPLAGGAVTAFYLLRTLFTVAPILFGLDKFAGLMTDWEAYLAPWVNDLVPGTAHDAMLIVGVTEVVAGLVVAFAPRFGGPLVAAWLAGIIVNLVSMGSYYDVALRDFGLMGAAIALTVLAAADHRARSRR